MPSAVIIGASTNRERFSNKAVRAYFSKGYKVYPVNPKYPVVEGLECYPSVRDVPEQADRACLYMRPELLKENKVLEDIAFKGIKKVFFNPGTESPELVEKAKELGLEPLLQCSIIAIGLKPGDF